MIFIKRTKYLLTCRYCLRNQWRLLVTLNFLFLNYPAPSVGTIDPGYQWRYLLLKCCGFLQLRYIILVELISSLHAHLNPFKDSVENLLDLILDLGNKLLQSLLVTLIESLEYPSEFFQLPDLPLSQLCVDPLHHDRLHYRSLMQRHLLVEKCPWAFKYVQIERILRVFYRVRLHDLVQNFRMFLI